MKTFHSAFFPISTEQIGIKTGWRAQRTVAGAALCHRLALAVAIWLCSSLAGPLVARADTVVDQAFTTLPFSSSAVLSLTGDTLFAQSFTVGTGGRLTGADLLVFDGTGGFGSGAPPVSAVTVQIRGFAAGLPTDTVLASYTVPASSLLPNPNGQFTHVDFSFGVPVVPGQVLSLVISGAGVGWFMQFGAQATYPGGEAFDRPHTGYAWEPTTNPGGQGADFLFRTYVTVIAEPKAEAPVLNGWVLAAVALLLATFGAHSLRRRA